MKHKTKINKTQKTAIKKDKNSMCSIENSTERYNFCVCERSEHTCFNFINDKTERSEGGNMTERSEGEIMTTERSEGGNMTERSEGGIKTTKRSEGT